MRDIHEEIARLGAEVLVITMGTPTQLADFERHLLLPFLIVGDSERAAYHAFALGRTRLWAFLRLDTIWHYVKLMLRGWIPKAPAADSDILQLGGDFVLDREGRLTFAYASQGATDRPAPATLLDALRLTANR